jgi:hypothetical protein
MRSTVVDRSVVAATDAAREAVDALVAAVDDGALGGLGHDELTAQLQAARALAARLEWVSLRVVREVDSRGSHVLDAALSPQAWLRHRARMSPSEAKAAVRTARALADGPLAATSAALAAGEIDPAHARLIAAQTVDAPAGAVALIEPEALAVARAADPGAVAGVMRRFAHALDPDGADAAAVRRYERRGVSLATTLDGMVAGTLLLDPVAGAEVLTALSAASAPVSGDTRSAAQRSADALSDICRQYLATAQDRKSGGGHPHLIVTVDADTLARTPGSPGSAGSAGPGGSGGSPGATLGWVGPVTASTAQRVGCDADVTVIAVGGPAGTGGVGCVREVERTRRFFTTAQRVAMIARDGDRCAVPYCDRPVAWSDAHHLQAWTNGGPTVIDNGALPCAAHHTLLHEGHWTLHRLDDGRYLITHPDGRTIGPQPHPPGHSRPPPQRE